MSEITARLPLSNPEGIKSPVNVATTGNIPLNGLQTINGYALELKDRVLVKDQNDPSQNGIYIALEHNWLRAQDWKIGSQVANGVIILDSHTNNVWRVAYDDTLFVDTTPVGFTPVVVAGNFSALLNFDYLEGGLNVNEYDFPVDTVAHVKTYSETLSGGITALWKKLDVTGPVSQLPKERLDLRCVDGTGAVWELLHTGEVFISTIGGDQNADNANVIRAFDNKAPYLNLEGKEWPCPGLNTDSGSQREILNSKIINGTLLITNSLSGETRAQTFAPYLESEVQLSETKSPIIDWTGLNVLWLGTSIPHQGAGVDSYPERVADKLNFNVQNYAWSGSHIFYDINGDAFDNGTIRALSMTEADRLAGLSQYGSSSTYDDSFNIVTKASEMTAEYRIKAQFENGPIDVVVLDHNHNDRKNVIEYPKNVKNITGATLGTSTTFNVDNTEGLTIGDGCYVEVTGATRLNYAAGRITGIGSNTVTIGYDSSSLSGTVTAGNLHWVDRNTVKGAWDFIIAYIKNMDARYGQTDVKIILSGAPSYFTNNVDRDHSIWSINRIISEIADSWGLYYFDVANALRLTYRDHINYLPDAVHPSTPETREVFTNVWAKWMRNGVGNFYNPQSVLQRNKTIDNEHNQPALYSFYDGAYARRDVIYIEDTPLIDDDFATDFDDWLALGTGSPAHVDAPWGSGKAVQFGVNVNGTSPYLRQDVPVGTVPVLEFDFLIDDDSIATGITQQLTIASISGQGGSGYNVTITQSAGSDLYIRATYNKGGFGLSPVVSLPNSSKLIRQDVKYRVKLDVIEGYARFTIDGEVIFKGAIDNEALQDAEVILVGPTFSNLGSAFNVFIGNVVAGAKSENRVMTTGELQKTVQSYTLAELQGMNPTLTGRRVICSDRADAPLQLAPQGVSLLPGDRVAANGRVWALVVDGEVNVKWFGAKGDNTTDDTTAIQDAIDRVRDISDKPQGGGRVYIPKGIYRTSGKLSVYSDVTIEGDGKTLTYIKPLDTATFAVNEAVIQTIDFDTVQGTNLWDYYSPYPNGLVMGFGIDKLCIDGNRVSVSNAGGLFIYGGKWQIGDIAVISTDGHGVWTECGIPGTSTAGDDLHDYLNMHESYAENVYICNANKHGWYYRGPNDSAITDLQVKTCGWGGLYQESTGNNSVGNLEISSFHAYSCDCDHDPNGAMVTLANANVQFMYVDASKKRGIITENSATIIDQLFILGNDSANAGYDAITFDVATQVNMIRNSEKVRTSGTAGTFLVVNQPSIIGQLRTVKASGSTLPQKIVELNDRCNIKNTVIKGYNVTGSIAIDVNSQKNDINANISNCETAIDYNTAGRNRVYLNALGCTNDITYTTAVASSDTIEVQTDNDSLSSYRVGRIEQTAISVKKADVGYSASVTPNPRAYSYLQIGTLTGALTVNPTTNQQSGDVLRLQFQQDGTGGRNITFDTQYKSAYSNTGNSAFKRASIEFYYDGTFWVQSYFSGWF
ncbi:MAG: putative pectate lyase superfamily protein [Prokaryotic dsDNA virus sp.]|nr:MAG: putative pectate lyase superfamily protein [Prokaryotic dsDNA virus sp.]|tara:strand:+ start:38652 stop:43094 length:4443 start_codon:yes stop_codon:yes gene_type:complete